MIDAGAVLAQIFRIIFGMILAFIAGGLFLAYGFFQNVDASADPIAFGAMVGMGLVWASILGGFAFIPALIAVFFTEILRLRSIVVHLAGGGAIAFGLWTMGAGATAQIDGPSPGSLVAVAAGFLAGFAYWLIAGRQAGCWRRGEKPPIDERRA